MFLRIKKFNLFSFSLRQNGIEAIAKVVKNRKN